MATSARNVLILCPDELRGDCLGVAGNPDVQTPHIDAFAQRAAYFDRHFTTFPKCVPARISMMTGRACHTDGYRTITQHMPDSQPDLMKTLRELGYQTSFLGKNHCWECESGDYSDIVDLHSWSKPEFHSIYDRIEKERKTAERPELPDCIKAARDMHYIGKYPAHASDDAYTEQAVSFLRDRRDPDRPFFLQVNIEAPHPKYAVEDPWFSMYDRDAIEPFPYNLPENAPLPLVAQRRIRTGDHATEATFREVQATYYGMVSKVDHQIGQILDEVERQGLLEDTIVIVTSDHGDWAGQHGLPEKWDTSFQDALTRVPFILHAPGLGAQRVEGLSSHLNVAATICELLDIDPLPGMQGGSLVPVLRGESKVDAVFADGGHEDAMLTRYRDELYQKWEKQHGPPDGKQQTYHSFPDSMARSRMIRTERWKMVVRLHGGNELYDLQNDPWEMNNLWDEPDLCPVVAELQGRLLENALATDTDQPYQPHYGA